MNKTFAIQLKAAFMLFIFSLNMFVGFACSIGLNAGDGKSHHHKEISSTNTHAHKHDHGNKEVKSHLHPKKKSHNHQTDHKNEKDKKGCCNDEVQKIQQIDKYIDSYGKLIPINVVAEVPQIHFQSYTEVFSKHNPAKLRERFFYPPPPNILLNIQRFQI